MKKLQLTFLTILLGLGKMQAQSFEDGVNNISIGYGIGTIIGSLASSYENEEGYKFTGTGPLFFKYEHGISDKIGLGLNVAYASYKFAYTTTGLDNDFNTVNYSEATKYTTASVLARLNVHFGDNDKFDPYWGIGLGYRTGNWSYESSDPNSSSSDFDFSGNFPFGFETTLGARYFFIPSLGAYAEVGLAKAVFQVGLTGHF